MKKIFMILLVNLALFSLVISCTPRTAYLDEFPYLPAHADMQLVELEDADEEELLHEEETLDEEINTEKEPSKALYSIDDVAFENALAEYENILHQDGWKLF